ncbi:MAG: hypothetical protein L0207_07095 [Chlamydiae bacterium]|nr:hypothetical protein [Chlamydiota bacterium]
MNKIDFLLCAARSSIPFVSIYQELINYRILAKKVQEIYTLKNAGKLDLPYVRAFLEKVVVPIDACFFLGWLVQMGIWYSLTTSIEERHSKKYKKYEIPRMIAFFATLASIGITLHIHGKVSRSTYENQSFLDLVKEIRKNSVH